MNKRTLFFSFIFIFSAYANAASIDGYWQTVDDSTGQPKGVIQIYTEKGISFGKVWGGYPVNGVVPHQICTQCPAPFTGQPVTGMQIIWGLQPNSRNQDFENGQILDPDTGHIYRATLTPQNNGQNLKVHGYIGIPLFGRTQIWNKLTPAEFSNFIMKYYPASFS